MFLEHRVVIKNPEMTKNTRTPNRDIRAKPAEPPGEPSGTDRSGRGSPSGLRALVDRQGMGMRM
jgi:hypothetical protein